MENFDYIRIVKKPKRNYAELLADSADFGSWKGSADTPTYEEDKKKRKKKKIKKLAKEISKYEL